MNATTLLTRLTAVLCTLLLVYVPVAPSETAQQQQTSAPEQQQLAATKIPNDQLDSLVAPIALSGPAVGASAGRFNISPGNHAASTMAREK